MKTYIFALLGLLLWTATGMAQSEKKKIREGNDLFEKQDFSQAEVEYRKALEAKPNYYKGTFNLGDALYAQENYEESAKLFDEIANSQVSDKEKSAAYYNLGNALLEGKKYEESINAYKNALRKNPDDEQARYNLEYARQMLKQQQQQQQQQDQNKDQNKDQDKKDDQKKDQNKDQNKDQDKKDDQQKDQDQKQDQEQNKDQKDQQKQDQNQDKSQDKKDQQQQQQPQQISKQDAQRMLDALKNDEKGTLQKLQKQKAQAIKGKKSDIDW